ncbi:MAG: hypothetical protein J5I90_06800 [Caldilineales bacterium]|nr:hypothetical protein [Caldilineales bacterium]
MASTAIATVVKMMETLPESTQDQVVEHLRDYIAEIQEERRWDKAFQNTQSSLIEAARRAKEEIAEGLAAPMDYSRL